MSVTWVGVTMLIFLAGLQDIPSHLYEAAELDGASQWRQMINITVPLMTPTIFFNLIINIIQGFQVFAQVLVMTGRAGSAGGPLNSTRVCTPSFGSPSINSRWDMHRRWHGSCSSLCSC
ncbi:MAG: sugar ABC transporter permease [Caldilineaceae bacterium]